MSDRIEKVAEIKVVADNTGEIEKLTNQINSLKADLDKLNSKYDSSSSSVKKFDEANKNTRRSVLENGGAMGLLSAATGGLAMDFKDAVEAIELTGVSLKGLRGAIIATGIGALAIVVLELVTNWDKWRGVIMKTTPELEALNDIQGDLTSKLKETYTELYTVKSAFDQARDGAISKKEALRIYNETLGDTLGKAKSLEEAEDIYNRKTEAYIKATELRMTAQLLLGKAAEQAARLATGETVDLTFWDKVQVGVSGYFFGIEGAAKKTAKIIGSNVKEAEDSRDKLIKLAQQYQNKADDISKEGGLNFQKVEEKKTATAKNSADELKKINDKRIALEDQQWLKLQELTKSKYDYDKILLQQKLDKDLEMAGNNIALQIALKKKFIEDSKAIDKKSEEDRQKLVDERISKEDEQWLRLQELTMNKYDYDILLLQQKYEKEYEAAEGNAELQKALAEKLARDITDINKKRDEEDLTIFSEKQMEKARLANYAIQEIGSISQAFLGSSEKDAKKAFEIDKAMRIASTIMSSIEGAQNAYTTAQKSPITLGFPGYPLTMAVAAGVFGAAKVAAIAKQKYKGSSSGTGGVGSEGGGGAAAPQANFNIVGQSDTNILAQTIANRQQQPIEAFVVGASVTKQQELDDNKIKNSTFL